MPKSADDIRLAVIELWNKLDGWIPGGAYEELAHALEVHTDVLLESRNTRIVHLRTPDGRRYCDGGPWVYRSPEEDGARGCLDCSAQNRRESHGW